MLGVLRIYIEIPTWFGIVDVSLLKESFGLLSSLRLCRKRGDRDVIPPEPGWLRDRIVAIISIAVQTQLLTVKTIEPKRDINHKLFRALNSAHDAWHISTPKASLFILANVN